MRKLSFLSTLVLTVLVSARVSAQDFSNKGNEFWFCFPNHIPSGNNTGSMSIWITSDSASSGTITMTNGAFFATFSVAANGITSVNIPHSLAHISNAESGLVIQKSLKISVNPGQPDVVAYAQQYGNARSAATLLLPTSVLGKTYRAASYTYTATSGGGQNSRSQFQVIATRPNTLVKVTPYSNGTAGTPFNISLPNTGDMYQHQAQSDITGTLIESIASTNGSCLPIAVFSGSSAATIGTVTCTNPNSFDPLFQQLYPISTWGKSFGFIPFGDYPNGNPYRIMAAEDNTNVYINGSLVVTLNAGQIYPATYNLTPITLFSATSITADKPISVIQYSQTSACSGTNNGDPDMVILNPIEQNISDITIFASTQQNINRQWLNVLIKTSAAPSFLINGAPPSTPFQVAANIPGYSYLQHMFNPAVSGSYRLTADSGFNAICYGFQQGNFESYAYSAGTNVRDLNQSLEVNNEFGNETSPNVCTNSPFKFKVYFPDKSLGSPPVTIRYDSMRWTISNPAVLNPPNFPLTVVGTPVVNPDSVNVRNGKDVAWYSLPGTYSINTPGTYQVTITVFRTSTEGCGNSQDYTFPLTVSNPPVASFTATEPGCALEPVQFTETTPQVPKATYRFWWEFGDPASGPANNSTLRNPTHTFTAPGTYNIRFMNITTAGCLSDTIPGTVVVPDLPTASISGNSTVCINDPSPNITFTGTNGKPPYTFTYNINGGPNQTISTAAGPPAATSVTLPVPTGTAGTFRYNLVEVRNTGSSLCFQPQNSFVDVVVNANTGLALTSGSDNQTLCINTPVGNIVYTVSGGGNNATVTGLPPGVTGVYNAGIFTISGTPTAAGTYNYTVTATGPCLPNSLNGTIVVNPDASITLTSPANTNNQEVCVNSPVVNITYAVGGTGNSANAVGLPAGVSGVFAGGVFTISGTPTVSGVFNYTVNATGICAPASATGTITVNALPTANFSPSSPSCETRTITFTDLSTPNSGNITQWVWNFGDGSPAVTVTPPASPNVTHTYTTAGTYSVSLVVTTDKGCVSTNPPISVVINVRPEAGFIVPEVCINDVATVFTDTSKISSGTLDPAGYYWDFGDPGSGAANFSTSMNGSHLYTAIGLYTVMHVVTSSQGCKDTTYNDIFINAADPDASFTVLNPTLLCANDSVSIRNTSTISQGSVTKLEIYWDALGAPGVFDLINVPVFNGIYKHKYPTLTTTTTYRIRMIAYSGTICFTEELVDVTVNAAPDVIFNPMPNICYDAAPYQIPPAIARETGGVIGNGIFSGPGVSPTGLFSPAVAGPGTHRILYTYTSTAGNCVDTASNFITVWDTASARIDVQALLCERSPVSFNSSNSTLPAGNGSITGWSWNFGDPASGASNTSNAAAPSHLFTGWGAYTVSLTVSTSNGCRSTVRTLPVNVNPIARPNFDFPASSCLPSANIAFRNLSTIPDNSESSFNYIWNFGDPGSGANNTATVKDPSHIYNVTGPFNVNLQVTSGAGCIHDTTIVLNTIHPQPVGSFTTDKIDVCIGGSINFRSTSTPADGTISQYSWDMDDGSAVRTTSGFNYTYAVIGSYDVTHFIINSFGCRSSVATTTVSVNPYPPVNAGPSKFVLEGGQVQLTPAVNVSYPVTYLWSPGRYVSDSTIDMPYAFPPDDMYFRLTVSAKGCSSSDTMFVKVLKMPDVPNIFSPNGDGVYDRWEIPYLNTYPGCTVDIVNRYGQLVFRSVGYGTPWDGKSNGIDVPIGTYYYVIDPKNGRKPMTGYVDIIR